MNLNSLRIYNTLKVADGQEQRILNFKKATLSEQKHLLIKDAFKN